MLRHVRVSNLVVGDVFAGDAEVTMIGPSSLYPGERYIGLRSGGRHYGTSLPPECVVQVQYP